MFMHHLLTLYVRMCGCLWMDARFMFIYVFIFQSVHHLSRQASCHIQLNKSQILFLFLCFFVFNVSSQFITCVNVQFALQYKSIGFDIEIAMWLRVWDDHDDDDEEELVFGH